MKGVTKPQQEAEGPGRRILETVELDLAALSMATLAGVLDLLESGGRVYIKRNGRRIARLEWTEDKEPLTEAERAAAIERLRNLPKSDGKCEEWLKGRPLTKAEIYG